MLYLARTFTGNISETISMLHEIYNVFLVGDLVYWQNPYTPFEKARIRLYDAITSYNMHTSVPGILADFENLLEEKYEEWLNISKTEGVEFYPSVIPGFNDTAVRKGNIPLQRSLERFKDQLRIALKYSWPRNVIILTSFNEWHEYTSVEPSRNWGMAYLDAVKEVVENFTKQLEIKARGIVYVLPSNASTPFWKERYGDRCYFYVYANLSDYKDAISEDFFIIRKYYDTVIVVIPADDTSLFHHNLAVVDKIAQENSLRLMWAIFPKWKYGAEEDYLKPGTPMNKLVIELMAYLSSLNSTWKIGVWYGWQYRLNYTDIIDFYTSLPENLRKLYAAWIDEPYAPILENLSRVKPEFLVVTELYSFEAIIKYSGKVSWQMIITGFYRAKTPLA